MEATATEEHLTSTTVTEVGRGNLVWLMQRVSAALLLFFLGAHFWVLHFAVAGEKLTFQGVAERLRTPLFVFIDLALVAVVVFHGLNGLLVVVTDFNLSRGARTVVVWLLWIVGVVTFLYGANALLPFMGYSPLFTR
ncbi:MAG: hypothetical protein HYU86_03750 [Chloroflexi bacterium]|nr:hypothetical protein [Chloroflexota bacterium]